MSKAGDLIRQTRLARPWTQGELAKEAGVTPSVVSKIERGGQEDGRWGSGGVLAKLCKTLGISLDTMRRAVDQDSCSPKVKDKLLAQLK